MSVQIANLTDVARKTNSRSDGSKMGHTEIEFRFGTDVRKFELDRWTDIKATSQNPTRVDLQVALALVNRYDAKGYVDLWDTRISLFEALAQELFFSGNKMPERWYAPKEERGDFVTLPVSQFKIPGTDHEKLQFMLLVTGAAVARWREITCNVLNIENAMLYKLKNSAQAKKENSRVATDYDVQKLSFDWSSFLRAGRNQVLAWLGAGTASATKYDDATPQLNTATLNFCQNLAGFKELIAEGYLTITQTGDGFTTSPSASLFLATDFGKWKTADKSDDLKIALRHARFVAFMDWRIGSELALRQNGVFAQG